MKTQQEIKDLFDEFEATMIRKFPPEEYGEDSECDVLMYIAEQLRDAAIQNKTNRVGYVTSLKQSIASLELEVIDLKRKAQKYDDIIAMMDKFYATDDSGDLLSIGEAVAYKLGYL